MLILNAIGFNLIWFGLIYYQNSFIPYALIMLGWHVYLQKNKQQELYCIFLVALIGASVDSLLSYFNVFIFTNSYFFIPLWLFVLWLAFACTLNHSLSFLSRFPLLQHLVSVSAVPLSYFAGKTLSAVEFGYPYLITYLIISAVWLLLLPLFFYLTSNICQTTKRELCHE